LHATIDRREKTAHYLVTEVTIMSMMQTLGAILFLVPSLVGTPAPAQQETWADFRFLMGTWVSVGETAEGSGGFTLEPDLQGKVLVRRNEADLPATKDRPAAKHEDLMVIYRVPGVEQIGASYYDNEDHVIQYTVSSLPEKKGLVFTSEAGPSAPRFRLTYTKGAEDTVFIKFEFAPPGKPDEFKTYLEGAARRKHSAK
jgi:hypothetical protein